MGIWVILAISMSSILLAGGFDSKFKKHPIFDQEDFFKEEPEPPKKRKNLYSARPQSVIQKRTISYEGPSVCEEVLLDVRRAIGAKSTVHGYCFRVQKDLLVREDGRCRVPNHVLLFYRFDKELELEVEMLGPVKKENEEVMRKVGCWKRTSSGMRFPKEVRLLSSEHGCTFRLRIDYCTSRWLKTPQPKMKSTIHLGG